MMRPLFCSVVVALCIAQACGDNTTDVLVQPLKMGFPIESRAEAASREEAFMQKWGHAVSMVSLGDLMRSREGRKQLKGVLERQLSNSTKAMVAPGANPLDMLNSIISKVTGAWSSIVSAFKTQFSQTLEYEQLARGWSNFKESTKVFKGEGLHYDRAPEFFKDIRGMIQIPAKYAANFDQMIMWIQFFDKEYWSQHDTVFNIGQGGSASHFTMLANNNQDTAKIDVVFLTMAEQFALAPDVFVISQSKSYLGGIFSSTTLKFKQRPAAITDEELTFVSQYFLLLAYQEIALAENLPAPPNPSL